MDQDDSISRFTVLTSMMFQIKTEDGSTQRLKVELGDHDVFNVEYSKGHGPVTVFLTVLVTLLFLKMLVAKDKYPVSILKSLGFTSRDIRRQSYLQTNLPGPSTQRLRKKSRIS